MNKSKLFILVTIISFIISLAVIMQLPEVVPNHWNMAGEIDGYGSRWGLIFLAVMPFIIYVGMGFTRKIDPKKEKLDKRPEVYEFFRVMTSSVFIVVNAIILIGTCNPSINVSTLMMLVLGGMLILMGNYMPRIPHNYFLGFRIPWAIDNEKVWIYTQRIGGRAMVFSGIVMIIGWILPLPNTRFIAGILMLVSMLYAIFASYRYFKKVTEGVE